MIHPQNKAERLALKAKKSEKSKRPSSQVRVIKEFIKDSETQDDLAYYRRSSEPSVNS